MSSVLENDYAIFSRSTLTFSSTFPGRSSSSPAASTDSDGSDRTHQADTSGDYFTFIVSAEQRRILVDKDVLLAVGAGTMLSCLVAGPHRVDEYHVDNCTYDQLLQVFMFLYTGEAQLTMENAANVLLIAFDFRISELVELCDQFLCKSMSSQWACSVFNVLYRLDKCRATVACRMSIVANLDDALQTSKLFDMSLPALKHFLARSWVNFRKGAQLYLFHSLVQWGHRRCDALNVATDGWNLRRVLDRRLQLIRFEKMAAADFLKCLDCVEGSFFKRYEVYYYTMRIVLRGLYVDL